MKTRVAENTFDQRILSFLSSGFAGVGMLLAAVGLYGVLAYNLARRSREIGVRLALGARSSHVRGLIARELAWIMATGTLAGIAVAAAAGRSMGALLFGLEAWDPWTYGLAVALLWMVAACAAYFPTRRALRVDPAVALRYE